MEKTILVIYDGDDWRKSTPFTDPSMVFGYGMWGDICRKRGIELVRACRDWFQEDRFVKYWRYDGQGEWRKCARAVKPTVVYDKTRNYVKKTSELKINLFRLKKKINRVFPMYNLPEFSNLLSNKLHQSVLFHEYIAETRMVEAGEVVANPEEKTFVVKEFHGSGGKNVHFHSEKEIEIRKRSLLQKRIKAEKEGRLRDVRLEFIGDELQHAFSRVASKESLHTNVSKGAYCEYWDLESALVKDLNALSKKILKPLDIFKKKIYSLEFMIDAGTNKPYLIEMNTMPGLTGFDNNNKGKNILNNFLKKLTKYLID